MEMMKPRWSDRVCEGVLKQPLIDARKMSAASCVSSMICRALVASSKDLQAISKSSTCRVGGALLIRST